MIFTKQTKCIFFDKSNLTQTGFFPSILSHSPKLRNENVPEFKEKGLDMTFH